MVTMKSTTARGARTVARTLKVTWALAAVAIAAALTLPATAQVPAVASQFDMVGFIQQATLDRPNDIFSGGTITVNNVKIIVPYYTILQMPAFALTWQELFAKAPAPYTGLQTGLAMQDIPKPKYTYEVEVVGNRLPDGTHVAGLLFISQQSLHAGQGFITAINFATGEVTVDGTTRVKPNDPIGRFSVGFPGGSSPDSRFTIDEDNPTVRASSSYPMCIPRSSDDALCPQKNRPLSPVDGVTHLGLFTMPAAASTPTPAGVPDPYLMAPFELGDYVTYNGILADDANGTYVLAHTMIAEATVLTAPGTVPAYTAIDVLLMGTTTRAVAAGLEGATRTRVEGWSTDGSGQIAQNVYAVDVDACSGTPSERLWLDHDPKTGAVIGGPYTVAIDNLVALGRWRFRPVAKDESFLPPVRMLMARNTSLAAVDRPVIVTPNGLRAGQYTAPIFEFIFPEANPPGGTPPPPNPFENFPFLVSGEGPYNGGAVTGQLSPWPGLVPPVSTTTCAAPAPPPPPPVPAGTAAPVAAPDTLTIIGTSLSFSAAQLTANDTGSTISLVAVSPASFAGGTITGTGPFVFTPGAGFTTSDSFTYEIVDAFGQTAIGVVTVNRAATVTVPNVVNLTQASASAALTAAGLTTGAIANANSATIAAGSVISQSPASGASVATGSAVALTVSLGPALVIVPDVTNQTQANAAAALAAAGLTTGAIGTANSSIVPAGSVIGQNPAAGTSAAPGSAVALTVSLGPALVAVPNVVNQTQANASAALAAAGLTTGAITSATSATVPAGSVISQNPAAAVTVVPGSAVALVVSSGPAAATPAVDATTFSDGTGARTTPAFSTTAAGDVLVALVGSDGSPTGVNTQTLTITGGGLTWTRVQRAATSRGVSEVWTATAPTVLTNVTVTSTQSVTLFNGAPINQSLLVVAFKNASAVGATAAASNVSTTASASLVPQATGSVVYGVGNDFDRAVTRTVGAGQTKIHEFLAPTGDTFWMQSLNATTTAGTSVTLNATAAGAADQWNFAIVEIKK